MKIQKTPLDGVLLLEPEFRFKDDRGETVCVFEEAVLCAATNLAIAFPKHNFSISRKNVLRGIHVSNLWKIAYCTVGFIQAVAVDCREGPTFGRWWDCNINEINRNMMLVPPMFGLAHLAVSDMVIFHYHWSGRFDGDEQKTYRWDDPKFGIPWMTKNPILSERDANAKLY